MSKVVLADLQILGSAFFFGIGFIGQRAVSVEGLGPMTCNALRFGLSALLLVIVLPLLPANLLAVVGDMKEGVIVGNSSSSLPNASNSGSHLHLISDEDPDEVDDKSSSRVTENMIVGGVIITRIFGPNATNQWIAAKKSIVFWGCFLGLINFMGSGLQQWGISLTSANKVAFIAGFDLFLTPIFSLFIPTFKRNGKPSPSTWVAVGISIFGLYLLSDADISDLQIGTGELLTLISTVFWTLHITYTDIATSYVDSLQMMTIQLTVVSILSAVVAMFSESSTNFYHHFFLYLPWMLFLAVVEGLGFTLMAMGQTYSPPTHAAIILSLEGVFASIASYIVLGETLTSWELTGCCLMLLATLFAKMGCNAIDQIGPGASGSITSSLFDLDSPMSPNMHGAGGCFNGICQGSVWSKVNSVVLLPGLILREAFLRVSQVLTYIENSRRSNVNAP